MIDAAVANNTLPPSVAAKLRGTAQWALCCGKAGRAVLLPISRRQYAPTPSPHEAVTEELWELDDDLRQALLTLREFMTGELPDVEVRMWADAAPPIIVLSDAMWRPSADAHGLGIGRVAYLVWEPPHEALGEGVITFAEADVPTQILQSFAALKTKKQYICDLEEVALAAPYFAPELRRVFENRHVIHFADNVAANCGAISGRSSSPSMARVLHGLQLRWAHAHVDVWIEFVKSEANLADLPSRGRLDWARDLNAVRIEFTFPPCDGWDRLPNS